MHKRLLALAAIPFALGAAEPTTLDTLVVTGSRTDAPATRLARTVSVIDREAIDNSAAASLAELLASRAGIEVLDFYGDGSRASFGLRGFGENAASNTLILLDGQPLNNPDIGSPDLGRIRLEDIERIEVLQGGSALWGNQAVGGVIHIVSRQTAGEGLRFERGEFDLIDVQARSSVGNERWQISLGGSTRTADNYRDNNALDRQTGSLELRLQGALAQAWLRLEGSNEFLQVPGGLFPAEVAADRRQSAPDFAGDFSSLHTFRAAAGLRADLGEDWQFDGRIARHDQNGRFRLSFRGFAAEPATQDRTVNSVNPQWTWRYRAGERDGQLAFGGDLQRADYRLLSQFGEQRNEQSVNDVYLTALLPLPGRLDLSLSARHSRITDRISDPGPFAVLPQGRDYRHQETLGAAGLVWQAASGLWLSANWDQVLRYPKVDEYFGSGFTPDSIALAPQTGDNLELGLRLARGPLQATALLYRLSLDNEIVYDPASFANTNLDRTTRDGLNLNLRWALAERLDLDLAYSRVDASLRDGGRIPLVAEQHGQLALNLDAGAGWRLQAQLQAASDRLAGGDTDASAATLPGYGVLNLVARWQREGLQLHLKLNNALDREYAAVGFEDGFTGQVASYPLPGMHLRAGLSLQM